MDLKDKKLKLTPKRIESLNKLNIFTREELVSYYPYRYEILNTNPIESWKEKEKVTFEGEVISRVTFFRFGRNKSSSKFDVITGDDVVHITIFNRPWARSLTIGQILSITGIYNGSNRVTAINYNMNSLEKQDKIIPLYSLKDGVQQRTIRDCIKKALSRELEEISDPIPIKYKRKYRLLDRHEALLKMHFPETETDVKEAYRTLKYSEFLEFFLSVEILRNSSGIDTFKQPKFVNHSEIQRVIESLRFKLTEDQNKALGDVIKDMESNRPLYRLVQGDVGCGKTIVAVLALYAAITAGYQGALLAPTEILAKQHYDSIIHMLAPFHVRIGLLYSGQKEKDKAETIIKLANGEIDIIIGTHSLLNEQVKFQHLGLVVADEQQRFGVEQRRSLREKGYQVDFLLMSATPIPRTLASTLYGDMDISTIESMPAGRKQVKTVLLEENSFRTVLEDIQALLSEGRQLYVICAAVDKNEDYDARNAIEAHKNISSLFKGQYQVGLLHGQMNSSEKQKAMNEFYENITQILVSTTVVEVGMNVVNATGMIIYNADRFGMSQLHQLRGRVQRGASQGYCWLLTDSKDDRALERLKILEKTTNGFEISYQDLRLRGPGDILGTKQSGVPDFILGNLIEDTAIINCAREDAKLIIEDPDHPDYAMILDYVYEKNKNNNRVID